MEHYLDSVDYFEYGPFDIEYHANTGNYLLIDSAYLTHLGQVKLYEGPGWVLDIEAKFLDASQAAFLADFLSDLNSTLVVPHTKEENIAFRKAWDERVEKGPHRPYGVTWNLLMQETG